MQHELLDSEWFTLRDGQHVVSDALPLATRPLAQRVLDGLRAEFERNRDAACSTEVQPAEVNSEADGSAPADVPDQQQAMAVDPDSPAAEGAHVQALSRPWFGGSRK